VYATGSCATSVVTEGHVTPSEVSLGCSLRRPRPIFNMVTGTSHPRLIFSMVTGTKRGKKPGMRRTYFRSWSLPDRASSGHVTLSLPVKRPH
jgi:hypothetical protein